MTLSARSSLDRPQLVRGSDPGNSAYPNDWTVGVSRRVSRGKQGVRLDGYQYQPADTIDLIGEDGTRLLLLVVPVTTDPWVAEQS
jgi:hypothetical protein